MKQIREYFEKMVELSERDWEIFSSKLSRQDFGRKTVLLEAGEIENYLSFISRGAVRFYIPEQDKGVGKTSLLANVYQERQVLYFYVEEKSEALLSEEFTSQIQIKFRSIEFRYILTFEGVFNYLMELAKTHQFTLIIDEFQRLANINPRIYGEMLDLWGNRKNAIGVNLILCGSVPSTSGICKHGEEPLFDLTTARIHLQPYSILTLKKIISDYHPNYKPYNLLALYVITGGVAQYVELFIKERAFTLASILDVVFDKNSFFWRKVSMF